MIFDRVASLLCYNELFKAASDFIQSCGPHTPDGRYELTGGGIFAKVESYWTRGREDGCLESHCKYIDVQSCLVGAEGVEIFNPALLETVSQDIEKDRVLYSLNAQVAGFIEVLPGDAAVFFPGEPHRPQMITSRGAEYIKKVVVKIPHA